ncbi:hypothetical protein HCN44_006473 [Aphidius gifuensis]|uniref:Uncharacterized protein n=1 Tax=Aphidius gifuensis TaxID=684658 RepID=A0A834XYU3_APHGI|nr:hypothetical protein HCN44_006473 [Aphidius gifuensis]
MSKQKHKMSVNKNKQLQIQKKDIEIFTDAFNLCWDLLKKNNYYNTENVDNKKSPISTLSVINGQKIYDAMINIIEDITKTNNNGVFDYSEKSILNIDSAKKPDYIEHQKINYGVWEQPDGWPSQILQSASSRIIEPLDDSSTSRYNNYHPHHHHHHHHHNYTDSVYTGLTNMNAGNSSMEKDYDDDDTDDDYGKTTNKKNTSRNQPIVFVPHELKLRAVTISRDNPTWSVKKIREESGCNHIVSKQQIERWGEQLERGMLKIYK